MSVDYNTETLLIVLDDDDDDIECLDIVEVPIHSGNNKKQNVSVRSKSLLYKSSSNRRDSSRSNVSYTKLDQKDDILTILRSSLTFYCVEDIYSKLFENICTYQRFLSYLTQQEHLVMKQTTVLEKHILDEYNSKLKTYNPVRYRLISVKASDYLIRLKRFLVEYQLDDTYQNFEKFISTSRSLPNSNDNCSMPTIINVEENVRLNTTSKKKSTHSKPVTLRELLNRTHPAGISFSQAIFENKDVDFEDLPRLVVRHRKILETRTIVTLGELFPTWFVRPTFRCIHCFTCDQVYTPRMFMLHVDDNQLIDERPLNISSIQLLSSEKISMQKVKLWNEFCSNLKLYAKEAQNDGFKDFLID